MFADYSIRYRMGTIRFNIKCMRGALKIALLYRA